MPDEEPQDPRPSGPLRHVETAHQLTEDTARRLISLVEGSAPVRRIRASQVVSALLATVGFVFVVAGAEILVHETPFLDNGWSAVVLGLAMLFVSGLMLQRLLKGE